MKYLISAALIFVSFCILGQALSLPDSTGVEIKNVGSQINSEFIDYAPIVSADGSLLIYTSRKTVSGKKPKNAKDRIYRALFDNQKNEWQDGIPYSKTINVSGQNSSAVYVSDDAQFMLIYRDDINTNGDIYKSRLIGYEWMEPESIGEPINTTDRELSACLSSDGSRMYFVSDRPGGKGRLDIWYTVKDSLGGWKEPVNMGSPVNTEADEDGVSLHQGGKALFFSCNGRNTIGGFDIFMSTLTDSSQTWTEPVNLGTPINTLADDLYFTLEANGKRAYYSSIRPGSIGGEDVYQVNFKENLIDVNLTLIKGRVTDKSNRVEDARIVVTNKTTKKIIYNYIPNLVTGKYLLVLPSGSNFELKVIVPGYDDYIYEIRNENLVGYKEIIKDFIMDLPRTSEIAQVSTSDTLNKTLQNSEKIAVVTSGKDIGIDQVKTTATEAIDSSGFGNAASEIASLLSKFTNGAQNDTNAIAQNTGLDKPKQLEISETKTEKLPDVSDTALLQKVEPEALIAKEFIASKIQKNQTGDESATEAKAYIKQVIGKDYKIPEELKYTARIDNSNVVGRVVDENGNPLKVQIEVIDSKSKQVIGNYSNTIASGAFGLKLPKGNYRLIFSKNCYLFKSSFITVSGNQSLDLKDIKMENLQNGKKIVLDNILFDYTKAKIRSQSYFTLDRTVYLLKSNPTLAIEIAGHTDNTYSAALNQKLSEERAKAVMDYLILMGIDQTRLTFKGYGYSQPVASNDTKQGRQLNRRTELKVLGENLKSEQTKEIARMKDVLANSSDKNKKINPSDASYLRFKQFDKDNDNNLSYQEINNTIDLFLANNGLNNSVEIIALIDFYLEE